MAKEKWITTLDILAYDLLSSNPFFHGDLTNKPEKDKLLASLEESLTRQEYSFVSSEYLCRAYRGYTHCFGFYDKIQSISQSLSFSTFGETIRCLVISAAHVYESDCLHALFDSCLTLLPKMVSAWGELGNTGQNGLSTLMEQCLYHKNLKRFGHQVQSKNHFSW